MYLLYAVKVRLSAADSARVEAARGVRVDSLRSLEGQPPGGLLQFRGRSQHPGMTG